MSCQNAHEEPKHYPTDYIKTVLEFSLFLVINKHCMVQILIWIIKVLSTPFQGGGGVQKSSMGKHRHPNMALWCTIVLYTIGPLTEVKMVLFPITN